jgi:hypothetical protein
VLIVMPRITAAAIPLCVNTAVLPAIATVAERGVVDVFAVSDSVTVPLPDPLEGDTVR